MITVIGMGTNSKMLTLQAAEKIKSAEKVFVKLTKTPTYDFFKNENIAVESFDTLFAAAEDLAEFHIGIADRLLSLADNADIVYCVDGAGVDDPSVLYLSQKTKLNIIAGVGQSAQALAIKPDTSGSYYWAYDVIQSKAFFPDKRHTVIIGGIDNKLLAADLKARLESVYGGEKEVIICYNVEVTDKLTHVKLRELDAIDCRGGFTAMLEGENFLTAKRHDFSDLIEIMERLLGEDGCPWDRAQTHESIRINLVEEAYELVDAIDSGDLDGMIEETGDVLLQAVFHAMLGKRADEYDAYDALSGLCAKLISRHTHIFGENKAFDPDEALKFWNNAKNVEKHYQSYSDKMNKIPKNLPALLYAYKIQKVAVKCGFDWHDIDGTFDKLAEEIIEFREAEGDEAVMEAGDLLFSAINPMRWRNIEPEMALRAACDKFLKRFKYMEEEIVKNKLDLGDEATREKYWALAKEIYK